MDSGKFTRMAFPGVSADDILPEAPRTLLALLDRVPPWHACEEGAVRALAKAQSVIASVKQRAARAGETLDAATEKALLPQAFGEAFVRDIAATMRGVLQEATGSSRPTPAAAAAAAGAPAAATATAAQSESAVAAPMAAAAAAVAAAPATAADDAAAAAASLLASPYHVLAACDYVPGHALAALTTAPIGWTATCGPFTGDDAEAWSSLVLDDLRRLAVEQVDRVTTSYAWVDPSEKLDAEYPALSEVLQRLHSLPYELNRKLPSLKLTRPHPGMTLVRRISLVLMAQPPSAAGALATGASGVDDGDTLLPFGDVFQLDAAGGAGGSGGDLRDYKLTCTVAAGAAVTLGDASASAAEEEPPAGDSARPWAKLGCRMQRGADATSIANKLQPMHAPNTLLLHRSREVGSRWELHASPKRLARHLAAMVAAGVDRSQLDVFVVQFFVHGPAGGAFV